MDGWSESLIHFTTNYVNDSLVSQAASDQNHYRKFLLANTARCHTKIENDAHLINQKSNPLISTTQKSKRS